MKAAVRRHVGYIVAGIIGSLLTAGGPSALAAAYDAMNADKVDGKHAVSAGATPSQRAGKLVATGSSGRLPNSIIAKAPDADRLDGLSSASFGRNVLPSGAVMSGVFGAGGGTSDVLMDSVNFRSPLPVALSQDNVHFVTTADSDPNCTGPGNAARGHLCVYRTSGFGSSSVSIFDPSTYFVGASKHGFGLYSGATSSDSFLTGTWTVRAP